MPDYIEREAALNVLNGWRDQLILTYGKNDEYVKCLEIAAEYLESLHAADVRPVVLCRDCEYYFKDEDGYEMCGNSEGYDHVTADGFCAWGEKREEADGRTDKAAENRMHVTISNASVNA